MSTEIARFALWGGVRGWGPFEHALILHEVHTHGRFQGGTGTSQMASYPEGKQRWTCHKKNVDPVLGGFLKGRKTTKTGVVQANKDAGPMSRQSKLLGT